MGSMFDNDFKPDYGNLLGFAAAQQKPNLPGLLPRSSKASPLAHSPAPSTSLVEMLAGLSPSFGTGPLLPPPLGRPPKFNKSYLEKVMDRGDRRAAVLSDRLADITDGRVMPDRDEITIGGARRFDLAVLDICGFSGRPNWLEGEQKTVLAVMNMFMAEMLSIGHDFDGTYEKNTGDGLMAYFGENTKAAFSGTLPGTLIACLYGAGLFATLVKTQILNWRLATWLAVIAGLFLGLSILLAGRVVYPRLRTSAKPHFGFLGKHCGVRFSGSVHCCIPPEVG